jgi:DNA-binding NarL/FixJ family response regulator
VILADDAVLIRHGLARLLVDAGVEVAAEVSDAEQLLAAVADEPPDVAVVDIRMPPTHTDEGLRAAREIRSRWPTVAVLVLSQHVEIAYALRLLTGQEAGVGYLLKDRVADVEAFVAALERVAAGSTVVDPTLVAELVGRPRVDHPLTQLSARELEVLALVAEGLTDRGIAQRLYLSNKTVEAHVRSIFRKLELPAEATENRRVHAVLAYLRA